MSRASRDLQIGDNVTTDFNRSWSKHVIIERMQPADTGSGIAFKVEPVIKGALGEWIDADWFEPDPEKKEPTMANPSPDKGNVTELLRIGGQMANVLYNLAQRRDDGLAACADDLRKQWDAARATPPSPSTAPEAFDPAKRTERQLMDQWNAGAKEVAERAAFEAWAVTYGPWDGPLQWGRLSNGEYKDPGIEGDWKVWQARAALASRPAEVADEARDAARYRWMRDQAQWFKAGLAKTAAGASSFHYGGELLDQLVDAGRAASTQGDKQ